MSVDDITEWIRGYECFPSRLPKGKTLAALRTAVEELESQKVNMIPHPENERGQALEKALASIRERLGIEPRTEFRNRGDGWCPHCGGTWGLCGCEAGAAARAEFVLGDGIKETHDGQA